MPSEHDHHEQKREQAKRKKQGRALRVLVVGEALLADGLTLLLRGMGEDLAIVAPLYDPMQVRSYLERIPPVDVIVMQWVGHSQEHIQELKLLAAQGLRCLLVVPFYPAQRFVAQMRQVGVRGIVMSTTAVADFSTAIRSIAAGQFIFPKLVGEKSVMHPRLVSSQIQPKASYNVVYSVETLHVSATSAGWPLNVQDIEMFGYLFHTNEEAASNLRRSVSTIRRIMSERIYELLSYMTSEPIRDRVTACRVALELGIYQVASVEQQENALPQDAAFDPD